MKKVLFSCQFIILFTCQLHAQNVGIGTTTPHASAKLDVTSTTSGFLTPRMNSFQRINIATPTQGLLVYDTDTNSFWFYNASTWTNLSSSGSNSWSLTGNSGTNPATHFIGTTDNQPLRLRLNNVWAGEINLSGNVSFGRQAGGSNTSGIKNTAFGESALATNSTGSFNSAVGSNALGVNTNGTDNVADGFATLGSNTTAGQNVAVGSFALQTQSFSNAGTSWPSGNVAVGYMALSSNQPTSTLNGQSNTAVGHVAMRANTTGYDNSAFGAGTLFTNTIGSENTAIGRQALFYNAIGNSNTATGFKALRNNTEGGYNTANGSYALYSNNIGSSNIAYGNYALFNNTAGGDNTAIGWNALYINTIGSHNTALGNNAFVDLNNSNNNTVIGSEAHISGSNDVAIGYNSYTNVNNLALLGSTTTLQVGGYANWSNFSDGRFKTNIDESVKGLDFIMRLRPVTYHMDVKAIYNLWGISPYGKEEDKITASMKEEMIMPSATKKLSE